ncbi:hypothetical protein ACFPYJ_19495 [Paenibacillus solisilvae]|uniref:DUF4309 domain-containing protein n=1 Tax=Paenibacillus solisilvae TaxID=2486751 RepID=A0ABW0W3E6_9BACL
MNKMKFVLLVSAMFVLILTSACGTTLKSGSSKIIENNQENTAVNDSTNSEVNGSKNSDKQILIVIDQTSKMIEGNSFDFVVKKIPEGYSLAEMKWISDKSQIVNTTAEAIQHGANGEDGFYISGNGQYTGFIYSDSIKGEEGEVVFIFKDDQGKELTWKKKLTLAGGISDENPQDTLKKYIQAVEDRDTVRLVELYGGGYQGLINLFPETDPDDKQKLVEQYLKLMPKITLKEIISQSEGSKDEYKFVITLKQEDGTLFKTREFDTITDKFTYTVKRVDDKLKIIELPPYQA